MKYLDSAKHAYKLAFHELDSLNKVSFNNLKPLEFEKIEKQKSGSTVFTLKILISEELIRAILSYGGEIEVLAPESLRQTIRQRAKQLASLYK